MTHNDRKQVNTGSLPVFYDAALFTMLDENNRGTPNGTADSAQETPKSENASEEDQKNNIDPALTREGRGKTP